MCRTPSSFANISTCSELPHSEDVRVLRSAQAAGLWLFPPERLYSLQHVKITAPSLLRLRVRHQVPREENLAMVRESVGHLKDAGKEVMLDLEHFFDGWKANAEYTMQVRSGRCLPRFVLCRRDQGFPPSLRFHAPHNVPSRSDLKPVLDWCVPVRVFRFAKRPWKPRSMFSCCATPMGALCRGR